MFKEDLIQLLKEMDLPSSRLDLDNESNLRWLIRNIWIRNSSHIMCDTAIKEVSSLLKQKENGQA